MAAVVTLTHPEIPAILDTPLGGSHDVVLRQGTIALDASYPNTGATIGEPIALGEMGVDSVLWMMAGPYAGYVFSFNYANNKLRVYYCDNNAVADGPLIEVPDGTDLVALTAVPFVALCRVTVDHEPDFTYDNA